MDKITDKLAKLPNDSNYFSFEFFPPKTAEGFSNILPRLTRLAQYRPLFVTVTWGAGGSTSTKSLDLAEICQRQLKLTTCMHLTCTNTSKRTVDDALQKAKRLGIRNILALRGDEPRGTEYDDNVDEDFERVKVNSVDENAPELTFEYAVDLVRYIRKHYGDWFCIGVAGYPDGHAVSPYSPERSVEKDIPFLLEKVNAGADFIMTQLFYDVDKFLGYQKMLREHESGAFTDIPVIPGLMPIQSWSMLTRTTTLSCASLPKSIINSLEEVKKDDEAVKDKGIVIMEDIVNRIKQEATTENHDESNGKTCQIQNPRKRKRTPQGFHFYTLNLERAVSQIVEQCDLIPGEEVTPLDEQDRSPVVITEASAPFPVDEDEGLPGGFSRTPGGMERTKIGGPKVPLQIERRRMSSLNLEPDNKVIVSRSPASPQRRFEALEDEAGIYKDKKTPTRNSLAASDGSAGLLTPGLGREATWDDYPNGRHGDARSPAFGSFDNWGPTMRVSPSTVLQLWGNPTDPKDITDLFRRYLNEEIRAIPWSEEALSSETAMIRDKLSAMNERGWWTVSSQPAIDGVSSDDDVVGWGPKVGGWVWQKPFVEFFLPSKDWQKLKSKLDNLGPDHVTYYAGDHTGHFETNSDDDQTNPVTWGSFIGKEILTPTIVDGVSFRSWQDEAFGIWREWQRCYSPVSPQARFLTRMRKDVWLVNCIGHEFKEGGDLWEVLRLEG